MICIGMLSIMRMVHVGRKEFTLQCPKMALMSSPCTAQSPSSSSTKRTLLPSETHANRDLLAVVTVEVIEDVTVDVTVTLPVVDLVTDRVLDAVTLPDVVPVLKAVLLADDDPVMLAEDVAVVLTVVKSQSMNVPSRYASTAADTTDIAELQAVTSE